jgi:hypothetical protein
MAYPTIDKPYGFKPVNLIGGQPYAGSTRTLPISYGYTSNIFYGDFVNLVSGSVALVANTLATPTIGVFLGCSFTDPVTKQKRFSQYWPASTLSGDAVAVIADDPDLVFKTAVVTAAGTATIASGSNFLVGANLAGNTTTGSTTTGNSAGGVVGASATGGNFRVMGVVPETQIQSSATYVSGTGTTTLTVSGLTVGQVLPIGTDVYQSVAGQLQFTGSVLTAAVTVASSTSQALSVLASSATILTTNPLVLVQSPEVLVKITFASHRYYVA